MVITIMAGVILFGSGSVSAIPLDNIGHVKLLGIGVLNNNVSFFGPMPINYVVYPAITNEGLFLSHFRQHDIFSHRMMYTELKTQ
jgi:hypothetical protein